MTARDSVSVLDPSSGAKPVRRDAVGAEIPVTVHASRTTQGLGKNLPAVHEETKTVIVLQQGAVVRLTANLMTGETVVLTNRMTGADVLCRVGKIKSQTGIQHYVDLEFMQRAPNFWGDALAAVSVPSLEPPAPMTAPPPPPARIAAPVAVAPPPPAPVVVAPPAPPPAHHAVVSQAPEPAPAPAPAELLAVAPQPVPNPALVERAPQPPPLPTPLAESPIYAAAEIQAAPLAEPLAPSRMGSAPSPATHITANLGDPSFGAIRAESVTVRSHKKLMVAAAAVVLVLGGGGGYWLYSSRQTTSAAAPAMQPVPTVTPAPTAPDLTTASTLIPDSDLNSSPAPADSSTPSPTLQTDIVVESQPPVESPARRVQPAPVSAVRTPEPPVRRNNVPIGKLQAPKAKTTAASVDAGAPPPAMLGAVNLSDGGATSALFASESAGPAPPPSVGGQLQQPQLISSTAAVYPSNARMQHIQGTVVLDALVDENGKVVETEVIAGPQPLVPAAQDAVRNWKYKPAQLNGRPIAVHTKVSVRFSLQ